MSNKNKKFNYSSFIKELQLYMFDSAFAVSGTIKPGDVKIIIYYTKLMKNHSTYNFVNSARKKYVMTPDEREQSVFGFDKFIYINKYNVMEMFGLIDQGYQGALKVNLDKFNYFLPFVNNEFRRRKGRAIGFYREYITKTTNPLAEAKIPDYLDIGAILLLGSLMFNDGAAMFRNELYTQIELSMYRGESGVEFSKVPFLDNLNYIVKCVREMETQSVEYARANNIIR